MSTKTTKKNEYKGIVDDGTRKIPIVNRYGKLICNIYIRPADLSILDRYNQLASDFQNIVAPLNDLSIKNDGTASFEQDWEVLKSVEGQLKQRINELFDMDEADEIFAKRNAFSSVGGKFFCENVIEAIGKLIVDAVEEEMKLSQKRTEKYLHDIQPVEVSGNAGETSADA